MVVREVNMMKIMMMLLVIKKNGSERSYYDDNDDAISNKKNGSERSYYDEDNDDAISNNGCTNNDDTYYDNIGDRNDINNNIRWVWN